MTGRLQGERPDRDATPAPAESRPQQGRPLEPRVRERMEARLGHDFGSVRIYDESAAAPALQARAFAVGEDVAFAPGQFQPHTPHGEDLLAHELGHVADHQDGAEPGIYRAPEGGLIPSAPEQPLSFGLGSLTLGLGTFDDFAFNGSTLPSRHEDRIPQLATQILSMLTKQPGGKIRITGHTDLVGGEQTNLDLGQKRAREVAGALILAGVPAASIEMSSGGAYAPIVQSDKPEPRNRRVEVRFAGPPIGTGKEPLLHLGEPATKSGVKPPVPTETATGPISGPPRPGGGGIGPVTPAPKTPPGGQQPKAPGRGQPEPTARPGGAGDVLDAAMKVPEIKKAVDRFLETQARQLGKATVGDKIVLGTFGASVAAALAAGLATDPAARTTVLDAIDGVSIPLDKLKLPGVALVPHTKGGGAGGVITFDLVKIFGGGK